MKLGIALLMVELVIAATRGFHWGFAHSYETESAWCNALGLAPDNLWMISSMEESDLYY